MTTYTILTDDLPSHFEYYQVDSTKTTCKFIMMPSPARGAYLADVDNIFAIAVYIEEYNPIFRKIPGLAKMSIEDVNSIISLTKPKDSQPNSLLNITTGVTVVTPMDVTPTVNYTQPSIQKIIRASRTSDVSDTYYKSEYLNGVKYDKNGKRDVTELTARDFTNDILLDESQYAEVFFSNMFVANSTTMVEIYDIYKKPVQVSVNYGVLSANNKIMKDSSTEYLMNVIFTDSDAVSVSQQIPVYQRNIDKKLPTSFYDRFGNTIIGYENNNLKLTRTKIPVLLNNNRQPIKMPVNNAGSTQNKRLFDVIA